MQVLHGPGLSEMPSALQQGRLAPRRLRTVTATWARQLRRAGVNMNLAPVLDTVPGAAAARRNPPIGVYDREFGYRPRVVARHGLASLRGMRDRGVVPTVKHFPGLGRVHAEHRHHGRGDRPGDGSPRRLPGAVPEGGRRRRAGRDDVDGVLLAAGPAEPGRVLAVRDPDHAPPRPRFRRRGRLRRPGQRPPGLPLEPRRTGREVPGGRRGPGADGAVRDVARDVPRGPLAGPAAPRVPGPGQPGRAAGAGAQGAAAASSDPEPAGRTTDL